MIEIPKLTGREVRAFDWFGWFMAFLGCGLMYVVSTNMDLSWTQKITQMAMIIFVFLEYVSRVAFGRIFQHVYYDTIIHKLYELRLNEDTYYVCAENEEELDLYMELHYPEMKYTIFGEHVVESFIKTEQHL
jgi:hypothetical protein